MVCATMSESRRAIHGLRNPAVRRLAQGAGVPLLTGVLRLYWRTCRVSVVVGEAQLDALEQRGGPIVFCFWHQRQLFTIRYLLQRYGDAGRLAFLVSPSRDGDLAAGIVQRLGGRAIRGSPNRTGAQALRALYLSVAQERLMPVLTPDGSDGPARVFKPGAAMLARLAGAAIVPMSYAARSAWFLPSWCRFMVPRPFTRVALAIGSPVELERGASLSGIEPALLERLATALNAAEAAAEAALEQT